MKSQIKKGDLFRWGLLAGFTTALLSCSDASPIVLPPEITAEERTKGIGLAEAAMEGGGFQTTGVMYVTAVERLRSKSGNETGTQLLVTHYRYEDDSAIVSTVDLVRNSVVSQQQLFDYRTDISLEEYELAKNLALEDARVKAITESLEFPVDVLSFSDAQGRRLLFVFYERVGTGIRYIPELSSVSVDLRSQRVAIAASED